MIADHRLILSSYASRLLSEGRIVFSANEAEQALGVTRGAFLDAAERLQRRQSLIKPRRGFYVVVPPQYASWGAPPPGWYIDDLMRHEGRPYYVGLLKAAELHGATHQAVMEFQVITDKRLPDIRAGRTRVAFYYRNNLEAVLDGIEERKTDTGKMMVSSVELTALDLVRYAHAGGGIDNIATVLADLGPALRPRNSRRFQQQWSARSSSVSVTCWTTLDMRTALDYSSTSCLRQVLFRGSNSTARKPVILNLPCRHRHAMSVGASSFVVRQRSTNDPVYEHYRLGE